MNTLNVGIIGCGNISRHLSPEHPGSPRSFAASLRRYQIARSPSPGGTPRHRGAALSTNSSPATTSTLWSISRPERAFRRVARGAHRWQARVFGKAPDCRLRAGPPLVDEAEARGLRLGCRPRHISGRRRTPRPQVVDDGAIGRILSGTAFLMSHGMEHWHPDPEFFYKPGGGPILDMAPYYLSTSST